MMNTLAEYSDSSISIPLPWQGLQWQRTYNAFNSGQMAHAYLFYGDKGLGKSLFASAFANLMLCATPLETNDDPRSVRIACKQCSNCLQSASGHHPDIIHIKPEDGSKNIKIEQIRLLSEFVIRSSHSGGAKIAIINEAHLLNSNAANALLKTLEEPNHNTFLFLISDYPGRLMATIRSRCQQLAFAKPAKEVASKWLHSILGEGNTDTFLTASMDRPLIALQYAESDALSHRQQFLQSLCDIKLGSGSIQSSQGLSSKIGEAEVLQHFAESLSTLIKYLLTDVSESDIDPTLEGLYKIMRPESTKATQQNIATGLLNFHTEIETARKQLSSSTNPNPQLIMESLLWHWSRLPLKA